MEDFVIQLALQSGLPGVGCFIGTTLALWQYCPNKGCCQMKAVRAMCEERGSRPVILEEIIRSEK
jgi:hypothetical protein